jgi:indole-3-glycerol phosphate synthase
MTKTILDKILADKKPEVARIRREVPLWALKERAGARRPLDFAAALRGDGLKLIAEVKKSSPSKGLPNLYHPRRRGNFCFNRNKLLPGKSG